MFRLASALPRTVALQSRRYAAAAAPAVVPTVHDLLIDLTFVDPSGARRAVKGMVGACILCMFVGAISHRFLHHYREVTFRNM